MRYFFILAFFVLAMPQLCARADGQGELPRAGAPRPLRLVSSDGAPLPGSPTDVTWERRGGGVFFTLECEGTRNIWRAFPDPQDDSRFPAWRALPVTDLRAPRYASQPSALPGERALVCVSNALAPATGEVAQIVRYDLEKSEFRALSDGVRLYETPQVSPDGSRVAFASREGRAARVFLAATRNPRNRVMPQVSPIRDAARRPVWLDDDTLLMENLEPAASGLYWMPASDARALQVVVGGGGEANTLGENGIVFSAKTSESSPSNLYLVARDGSGLRLLGETGDARRPAVSPDGRTLAFDAPLGDGRALWVLPLLRAESPGDDSLQEGRVRLIADGAREYEGPIAQLSAARATAGGVAIIGSLRGAPNSKVTLEAGEGEKPRRWQTVNVTFPPTSALLDAQGNRVLALWNPPPRARGSWTLRLSLSGLGGGAQSLLRVRLPLPLVSLDPTLSPLPSAPPGEENAGVNASDPNPAMQPLPRATPLPDPPDVLPVPGAFLPSPAVVLPPIPSMMRPPAELPKFPAIQPPLLPSPAVAPSPVVPAQVPTTKGIEIAPIDPARFQALSNAAPPPVSPPPVSPPSVSAKPNDDESDYGDRPDAAAGALWVAQFNVAGTPARMAPREKVKVTFWGWNRGTASWQTGARGENRVRLVARWVDFSTGTRRQWNYFWLREAVASGARTQWEFDVPAPARPGKYKLIYGLVRLPADGEFQAPAYSAPQEAWPDEFGAIAFAVEVAPNSP